ncbi:hypothetical protein IWW38_004076 [Coemansia aciculifera]|uniref:Uncharacterized protein n=1 Tax=Coemansia aciculifera TaxID=417176 RepID=A0ACC1LYV9_9FUNG|nr:hypothetical protein IWW38_004076 [Coemansia aciculifera]
MESTTTAEDLASRATSVPDEDGDEVVTACSFLESQANLEREAAEVLPGKFDECTYDKGYIRQPLYACLTCTHPPSKYCQDAASSDTADQLATDPAGMCYSCSIECHAGHEVIELFTKRQFRCDCGTKRLLLPAEQGACCQLKSARTMLAKLENVSNVYNHNFWGMYCSCDKFYVPEDEAGVMIQCYVCNDWYHDSCIGELPSEDDYEDYVCRACVSKHPVLRYIDSKHLLYGRVVDGQVSCIEAATSSNVPSASGECSAANDEGGGEPTLKRARSSVCRLRRDTAAIDAQQPFDLFLAEGWKNHVCTCIDCMREIEANRLVFLVEEDDVVEPEEDETRGESLYESAMKKLRTMDHTRAVDAASAYQSLSSNLKNYLRPFASSGKVVKLQDIQTFFEQQKSGR